MKGFLPILALTVGLFAQSIFSQTRTNVKYPFEIKYFPLSLEKQNIKMASMDVAPQKPNGAAVILFHGNNFNDYYWKDIIPMLARRGFRVVVPDQIGWGKSDRPNLHYSFHALAANNKKLLDSLGIKRAVVIGHSMGGMLAVRFALMYPETVSKLVLENPIGLEDYRAFVPFASLETLEKTEFNSTAESYRNYQKTYYPAWKPEYEQCAQAQAADLKLPNFAQIAWVNALTFQMIYEQPVVYEFANLKAPTLFIIGQLDRTVVGKNKVPQEIVGNYGNYPKLGKETAAKIKNSKLVELEGVGHIPHIQTPDRFEEAIANFLK